MNTNKEEYLIRDAILINRGFKDYDEYLNSVHWKNIKTKVKSTKYKNTYNKCKCCNSFNNIHLHHENYKWILTKYELRSIIALCSKCHKDVHNIANYYNYNLKLSYKINMLENKIVKFYNEFIDFNYKKKDLLSTYSLIKNNLKNIYFTIEFVNKEYILNYIYKINSIDYKFLNKNFNNNDFLIYINEKLKLEKGLYKIAKINKQHK